MFDPQRVREGHELQVEYERAAHVASEKALAYDHAKDGIELSNARKAVHEAMEKVHAAEAKLMAFVELYAEEL